MRWRALSIPLALGALAVCATPASSQEETEDVPLIGRIVDSATEQPLAGAWVALRGADWGTFSNADGAFRLPRAPQREAEYEVELIGYATSRFNANPREGFFIVRVAPDPVLLEGFRIVSDRFRARRNASSVSVRAFDREELTRNASMSMEDFLRFRSGISLRNLLDCFRDRSGRCDAFSGGRSTICIDEAPFLGGLENLDMYMPYEFELVEVYGRGTQIRLYTEAFMKRAANRRLNPAPLVASFC